VTEADHAFDSCGKRTGMTRAELLASLRGTTMKRDAWEFEHAAAKLAEAAEGKKLHHLGRLDWWEGKKAEVMASIREKGISVHESVAVASRAYSSALPGASARIMVDATLQRDLDECTNKVGDHRRKVELYDGWAQVLLGGSSSAVIPTLSGLVRKKAIGPRGTHRRHR
jgi:hypothetical protein